jgi:hypothetical protein
MIIGKKFNFINGEEQDVRLVIKQKIQHTDFWECESIELPYKDYWLTAEEINDRCYAFLESEES